MHITREKFQRKGQNLMIARHFQLHQYITYSYTRNMVCLIFFIGNDSNSHFKFSIPPAPPPPCATWIYEMFSQWYKSNCWYFISDFCPPFDQKTIKIKRTIFHTGPTNFVLLVLFFMYFKKLLLFSPLDFSGWTVLFFANNFKIYLGLKLKRHS